MKLPKTFNKARSLFSIDEICEAWLEFNKPYWIVDNARHITPEELKPGMIIRGSEMHQIPINYGDWIPFLVKWKKYHETTKRI
jgi:hypothetical protein